MTSLNEMTNDDLVQRLTQQIESVLADGATDAATRQAIVEHYRSERARTGCVLVGSDVVEASQAQLESAIARIETRYALVDGMLTASPGEAASASPADQDPATEQTLDAPARSRRWRAWIAPGLIVAALVGHAGWGEYRRLEAACSMTSSVCFDSGWQEVTNAATTTYFFKHHLGVTPAELTVWFSPTPDGARAFPLIWRMPNTESGNPIALEARPDAVYIHIWNGMPLHGHFEPARNAWMTYTTGYFRVVARR